MTVALWIAAIAMACVVPPHYATARGVPPLELRLGGWKDVPVTRENSALLLDALGRRANYAASIAKPVCVQRVLRVRQQLVNGMNYAFEVNGCAMEFGRNDAALGTCTGRYAGCRVAPFEIRVFAQPRANTLRVQSIAWLD